MPYTQVNSRAALNNALKLEWNQGGRNGVVDDSNNVYTLSGHRVIVSHMREFAGNKFDNQLERRDQSAALNSDGTRDFDDWSGNFAPLSTLIHTGILRPHDDPIKIVFRPQGAAKVTGAGAQIQIGDFGAFVAGISVYDSTGAFIKDLTRNGTSSDAADDSAIFLGVAGPDIGRLEFWIQTPVPEGFAVNALSFVVA